MRRQVATCSVLFLLSSLPALAQQSSPLVHGDVAGYIGWLNGQKSELESYSTSNDWYNSSVYGGLAFGWYWTDHHKTEVETGVSSIGRLDAYIPVVVEGRPGSRYSTYDISTTRVAVSQQYQFLRNAWVHPFVGAGIDLTWERVDRRDRIFSGVPLESEVALPRETDLLVRPFAVVGLKGYFAQRAFIRTDLRLAFDGGIDEALVRFGIGVDF